MTLQIWKWILVGATFTLYNGIAICSRVSYKYDFYVAGGGVSSLANSFAKEADWMLAATFISMAVINTFSGYDDSAYLMGWTGSYVLLAFFVGTD